MKGNNMARQGIIGALIVSLSLTLSAAQRPRHMRMAPPPQFLQSLQGLTQEEQRKKMDQWRRERTLEYQKAVAEWMKPMRTEAWERLLRVTQQQWQVIKSKREAWAAVVREGKVYALQSGLSNKNTFRWYKYSEGSPIVAAKDPNEMIEGEKITDALIDLLRDPNSTDAQFRQKLDALHQLQDKTRKVEPKLRKELAAALTTPRQEAVFLLMGDID
jgi:hypothetical protein